MPRIAILAAIVLAFATLALPSRAADMSLIGTWEIVDAAVAPWVPEPKPAKQSTETKRLLKMKVTFTATSVSSKYPSLSCKEVSYEPSSDPPDVLFQGSLPEPNQDAIARSLGFPKGDVPGVDMTCNDDLPFHFLDANTALFALNNVIYTMKRATPARAH